ncbi:PucR family transcriptional regulator ligand-binding domain-containing protein [Bacillus sp. B190/17]|uniref:PucR family transcriptional regulator ligand-binding domain-containing protein n=1 Tax=Bacillus lumedeiriae TaxID=3058829 RepID=A0ABW8IBP4_9BACI
MKNEIRLSVQEILELEHFRKAKVVAGKEGIHRKVKWVHVMEISDVSDLLNGDELILSTGVGWKKGKETLFSIVQQLIDCQAAGLCIEIGEYLNEIPDEIIQLADRYDFPVIVFYEEVRFVDITESVHTLIIKKQYQMITDLEDYSRRLNEVLLETDPKEKVLNMLHEQIGIPVIYVPKEGRAEIVSSQTKKEKQQLLQGAKENKFGNGSNIARQQIHVWNQSFAELIIISEEDGITEFETLILDRTVTALAQVILRELWTEERRKAKEADWIQGWLTGEHNEEQITAYLAELEPAVEPKRAAVLLCKMKQLDKEGSNTMYFKMVMRSIFQEQGFFLLSAVMKRDVVFILLDQREANDCKQRIKAGIDQMFKPEYVKSHSFLPIQVSLGTIVGRFDQVEASYEKAKVTAIIRERADNELTSYFYEDLHIYRLIYYAHERGILQEFVSDYLTPILLYDQENNASLMNTLKVYLECSGSKKETAERLYIVRQTLYHRLEKLYELLGEDFMKPAKRQAIEAAISAYKYLELSNQTFPIEDRM